MPRYLMLDHGGVLDGEMYKGIPSDNDLILSDLGEGIKNILKNGVTLIQQLSELVERYDYQVVFHSKNQEADQLRIVLQLQKSCMAKRISFPPVTSMAVYDPVQYADVLPTAPAILRNKPHKIAVIGYGKEGEGKSCVRQALAAALNIAVADYKNQIVFDDGPSIINKARAEGYQAYRIGTEAGAMPLFQAIAEVYERQLKLENTNSAVRP